MISFLKKYYAIFLIIFLSFWAVKPLFVPGFFPMHDDTQVARVFEMGKALADGMFPVRWVSDLGYGYGYPIFNFYAPLAYYFGGFLHLVGADALLAVKTTMVFGIVLSGIFMYLLAKEFWGTIGGVISSVFYVYAPYHAVDIYVRGDVAEFWAYAFIPLVFYSLRKVYKTGEWKFVAIGALGYSGIILSHNLTAMMVTPFILIAILLASYYAAIKHKKKNTTYYLLFTPILGIMLSAFYFLPAIIEMNFTNVLSQIGGGADFRDNFVCFYQLWHSPWGFGGSVPGCIDGMSFIMGKWHVIASSLSLIILFWLKNKDKEKFTVLLFAFLGLFFSIFLLLEQSKIIWENIYLMSFFQYPWRFLVMVSFFSSFIAGSIALLFKATDKKILYIGSVVFIALFIMTSIKFFSPQTIFKGEPGDFTSSYAIKWDASKTSDEYMPQDFQKPKNPNEIPVNALSPEDSKIKISDIQKKTQTINAVINSDSETNIDINLAYFPAWKAYINGKRREYQVTGKGLSMVVPKGKHELKLVFEETRVEKIGNIISLSGLFVLIIGIILSAKGAYGKQ